MNDDVDNISLLDVLGVSVDDVAEVRFSTIDKGVYLFEIGEVKTDDTRTGTKEMNGEKVKFPMWAVNYLLEIKNVEQLAEKLSEAQREALIGRKFTHQVSQMIVDKREDALKFIGLNKAFVVDVGGVGKGSLKEITESVKGKRFLGTITHQVDKNDTDKKYARLSKIKKID